MPACAWGLEKDCIMHCRRYHNIHCLWNSRFVPCAFDCDAERGLLLHTPTFSARPGADGLETFSLFFYSSLLFQGQRLEMLSAKSKATLNWLQRSFVAVADRKGWFWSHLANMAIVQNVTYLSKNSIHKDVFFFCFIVSIKMLYCGGGR